MTVYIMHLFGIGIIMNLRIIRICALIDNESNQAHVL